MSQDRILTALSEGGALHALTEYNQFVIYKLVPPVAPKTKWQKLPCDPQTGTTFAKGSDWQQHPENLVDWFTAWSAAVHFGELYGVAFLFTENDPFLFVDVDNCVVDGQWNAMAMDAFRHFPGAALEISQSGTGIHLFAKYQHMPDHGCRKDALGLEFYHTGRFVALTGNCPAGSADADGQLYLQAFINAFLPAAAAGPGLVTDWTDQPRADWRGPTDDDELINRLLARKRKVEDAGFGGSTAKHAIPRDLWENNESVLAEAYPVEAGKDDPYNRSSADMALAQHLAFYTGCDCERIERLMRRSALAREKWDDHGSYLREFTIMKAVRQQVDVLQDKEPVRAVEWTSAPVALFCDESSPIDMLNTLLSKGDTNFATAWNDGASPESLVSTLAWRTGGNCEQVRQILDLRKDIPDTPELRQAIMSACAKQETFFGVSGLDAQKLIGIDLERQDFAQAEAVICGLLPDMLNVFKRDNTLVWVNSTGQVVAYGVSRLSSKIETYIKLSKGKKLYGVSLPDALANRVLSRQDYPELGELKAAIQYPTARADGSVITQHGLDTATGLYLARQSDYLPQTLDRQGLVDALARVWAPFREFPYDGPVSAATMLAALLTCVCRVSIETAPAFLISAQAPGTGKSKLCECLMLVAGESKTSVNFPSEAAEQEKTLTAMLLRAPRGMFFDNLKGYLRDTSSFCMAMTSSQYRARMLGGLNSLEISNRALWVLNGNNVVVTGDAVRRVLTVGMDSPENPGERNFDFDPVEFIEADPERYRRDLLDILHTYAHAGRPREGMGGYASFDVWNKLVRGCVLWLEREGVTPCPMQDPMESIRLAREDDPDTQKRELFVSAWAEKYGSEPMFLGDVVPTDPNLAIWNEAYAAVCERKGRVDSSHLPYYLRSIKGRKTNGYAFVSGVKSKRGVPWKLEKLA